MDLYLKKAFLLCSSITVIQACVPQETPAPVNSEVEYTVTVNIPEAPAARPQAGRSSAGRNASAAASFAIVDIDRTTGKVTKEHSINNASDNGDGTWGVFVDSNPNAASVLIVHENDNAPVICINCDLPGGSVYAPLDEIDITVDTVTTVTVDTLIDAGVELTLPETVAVFDNLTSITPETIQADETLDEYLDDIQSEALIEIKGVITDNSNISFVDPYVMLMIDYRPPSFSIFCSNLDSCMDILSQAAFIELCSETAIQTPILDPDDGSTHRPDLEEQLCRNYYLDVAYDGVADGIWGSVVDIGIDDDNDGVDDSWDNCPLSIPPTFDLNGDGCDDNTEEYGNLNTTYNKDLFQVFSSTLAAVINDYSHFHLGLITPNHNEGGSILEGYKYLQSNDANRAKEDFFSTLWAVPTDGHAADAHRLQPSETFLELYYYLNGMPTLNHTNTATNFGGTDYPSYDRKIMKWRTSAPCGDYAVTHNGWKIEESGPVDIIDYYAAAPVGACLNPAYTPGITDGEGPFIPDTLDPALEFVFPFTGNENCVKFYNLILALNVANDDDDFDTQINTLPGAADMGAAVDFEAMLGWMSHDQTDLATRLDGVQNMKSWIITDVTSGLGSTEAWAAAGGTGSTPLIFNNAVTFENQIRNILSEISYSTCY